MSNYITELTLPVSGMSCAACASSVESMLKSQDGILQAEVNYATASVRVRFNPMQIGLHDMQTALKQIGYDLVAEEEGGEDAFAGLEEARRRVLKQRLITAAVFSTPVFVLSMIWHHPGAALQWLLLGLSLPVIFYSGAGFYLSAFRLAKHLKTNMDTLVALGTGAAFVLSVINTVAPELMTGSGITGYVYYESAVVIITLILLGRYLEERSRGKASAAIRSLMDLSPATALRIAGGSRREVPVAMLMPGDTVLVRPGSVVPVDGIITSGSSWIEESMMSGEPVPVFKGEGDPVLAGTLNTNGALEIRTLKSGKDTALAGIIRMVNEAQNSKPPVQQLVDRISSVFVPVVILLSILTFAAWAWIIPAHTLAHAIVTSISVLIIACPCALGLATPTALIAAIGRGASAGILFREAAAIETAGRIDTLVIDKTGTLTKGRPSVMKVHIASGEDPERIRHIFASVAGYSDHPLSAAVSKSLTAEGLKLPEVTNFSNIPGKGITANCEGTDWVAGSPEFIRSSGADPQPEEVGVIKQAEADGSSLVVLAGNGKIKAIAILTDPLREDAVQAVQALHDRGISIHMLTGDHESSAARVAAKTGIKHYVAGASPEDKAEYVSRLKEDGHLVAVAGDGINDTIALARADAGIAMGGGTDASREAASITLTGHRLMQVTEAIILSAKSDRIIKQNLWWAFGYNVLAIPVAAGLLFPFTELLLNPMIASAAMAFSSVSVVLNSLRLRSVKLS